MGRKFRGLVGALKDKASQTKASLRCTTSIATSSAGVSPHYAVLRATTHHPPDEPPSPSHLNALLSFGSAPRTIAAALVSSLSSRLRSTRDASVALKCLLALRYLAAHGAFIIRDQLSATLLRSPGDRNPLLLSSFRDASSPESWALSSWVRWLARVLELLVAAPATEDHDSTSSLLTGDLLRELDSFVELLQEMRRFPTFPTWEGNALVREVNRVVKEDRITAENGILVRVREANERLGSLSYADSVELACLLKRLEEVKDKDKPSDGKCSVKDLFWNEIETARELVGDAVLKREVERRRVQRERVGESARIMDRLRFGSDDEVRFRSYRWVHN